MLAESQRHSLIDGMEESTSNSTPTNTTNGTSSDPLLEQMRSILNLGPSASDPSLRRGRRRSDTDRPSTDDLPALAAPTAILSRDGTRWLPAPDERSQRYSGSGQSRSSFSASDVPPVDIVVESHDCSSQECAIRKVFETTELLESILSYLETPSIFEVCTANRQWYDTIHQSPQLRLHFFTVAQWSRPSADYRLLPLSLPGLTIERGEELHLGQWISVTFSPEAARRVARNPRPHRRVRSRSIFEGLRGGLGSQAQRAGGTWPESRATPTINSMLEYEDLFVTQPPVLGMQAYLILPPQTDPEPSEEELEDTTPKSAPACAKISCESGIQLGFLAETAQDIIASDTSSPSNIEDARIVFKAIMSYTDAKKPTKKRSTTRSVVRIS